MIAAFLIASGTAQQFLSILLLHDSSGEVGGATLGEPTKKHPVLRVRPLLATVTG
jgi:hypothetical protein